MVASKLGNLDDAPADTSRDSPSPAPDVDNSETKADEVAPVKRGRGRPPKPGGPAPKKPVVLTASGEPRKRGRPRKEEGAEPKAKVARTTTTRSPAAAGRRGRKKKEDATPTSAKKPTPKKPAAATRRGKKEEPEAEASDASDDGAEDAEGEDDDE
ncbi:hypothetical protein DRE_00490 [Drechslerella stenobrocha 248]|uniref:Uncharacterized protein n=1 Tax=Drechslerella stenobrocha 248 TaxID=1043628 RepID=W7I533_9PEZI|nr:hypothetical protein DRE_00490 [Drechslerella stenobrocha 248]